MMMLAVVPVAVALVAFILYALDRRSKEKDLIWPDALKLTLFSGLITSGVMFATAPELPNLAEAVNVVSETVSSTQDMFVGSPTF
jgi:hypothetical protein